MSAQDVRVINHGSIVVLDALTIKAEEWLTEHLPDDVQRWGRAGYVVEPGYVADILMGLEDDGLEWGS